MYSSLVRARNIVTKKSSNVIFIHSRNRNFNNESSHKPLVSFVIPVLNAERTLERCLQSIVQQDYPFIEILIIDGGSTDNSIPIARKFGAKVYFLRGPLGDARRLGIDNSKGELIALWDSDVYIPHLKWLSRSVSILREFPRASTLWVYTVPPPGAGIISKVYSWYSWAIMLKLAKEGVGFWGGGISIFRRDAVVRVGGITEGVDTGEDYDLARKLTEGGFEVIFYDDPVYHDSHNTLSELVLKDFRRAKNFKRIGLTFSTGVPPSKLIKVNLEIGLLLSLKNLFTKKEIYYGITPLIVFLRLITYALVYLLP